MSSFRLAMNLNLLKHLPKIYHKSNCLEELLEMHTFLLWNEPKYGKRLRDAMAREKIARTGLGLKQKVKSKQVANVRKKIGEKWEKSEKGGKRKEMENHGNNGENGVGNGQAEDEEDAAALLPPIDLDPDFLKTLEKLAETSSHFGMGDGGGERGEEEEEEEEDGEGESCSSNSAKMRNSVAAVKVNWHENDDEPPRAKSSSQLAPTMVERNLGESKDVAEWRQRFEEVMAVRYAKSERIRFLFCRKMYGHYVERMRQINRLKNELRTCKEKRLIKKFDLDREERVLLDRNSGKPYLCYEDIFDAIRNCHMQSDVSEMRMLFSQLKEKYANITFECVLEYFKVRNKQQQQQQWPEVNLSPKKGGGQASPAAHFPESQTQRLMFLENSSGSEDGRHSGSSSPTAGGKMTTDQLNFSRSKYRNLFHTDDQNSVYCKLCPFMLTASSTNQTYQKIRNHVRYNHTPWNSATN